MQTNNDGRPLAERHLDDAQMELYLMGELSGSAHTQLLAHLDVCEDCSKKLQNAAKFQDLLISAVADLPPPPPRLRERIRAALNALTTPRWVLVGGLAAASAAVVLSIPAPPPTYDDPELRGMVSIRDDRGNPEPATRVFSPTGKLSVRARPSVKAERPVVVYAELVNTNGERWSLPPQEAAPNGAISAEYELAPLNLPVGDYTLRISACTPWTLDVIPMLRVACQDLTQSLNIGE